MLTLNHPKTENRTVEPIAVNSVAACKLLGVSSTTLTKWTRENLIPHNRVGRRLFYSVEVLKRFAAGELTGASAQE